MKTQRMKGHAKGHQAEEWQRWEKDQAVYPSSHTALELYVACNRKAKRTKKCHRDCEETTRPSEATLYVGLHLPLV